MEDIATRLAVDAVKAITKVVAGSAFEEMKLVWGFKDQLEKLKKKFKYIEAFLNDIEKGKHVEKSELVNVWVEDVKDVACSAENLLDDYQYEMLRRKIELKTNRPSFKKKCRSYMKPSTNPIVFRIRMTHRVKQILSDLDELEKRANDIGLQPVKLARDAVSTSRFAGRHTDHMDSLFQARKHAAATGSQFIGRERDKEELLQMILNPSTKKDALSIIAIVGIGGLGKTTLGRQLFEDRKIGEHFARKKVWICVSEDFHVDKILKEMAESLEVEKRDLTNTDAIIEELKKVLEGKKFFLVLDDVWNDDKELWNSLTTRLRNIGGMIGSVILITTRSHEVAREASASHSHDLKGLSKDEGWELLKQQCFKETMPLDSSFDDVGKRIVVEKCGGVPLAIKSIGGLLQSKQHKSDWESIEGSEQWYFKAGDKDYIMPSLLLSYNHIVHVYVKQCFAKSAIFPKDSVMEKGQLIALWLAEGLLHEKYETSNLSATQEIIGEDCINELVKYSFLQEEIHVNGQIRYKMHDLVHDLATYVSRKDLLVLKARDKVEHGNYSQRRHLVLKLGKDELVPDYLTGGKMRNLRTISLWHEMPRWNSLLCARYVRTLVMINVGLTEVPSVILQLIHLRYLDLSENHQINELPELICKLYQLQTLRLLDCFEIEELPRELHKLENIRHIETSHKVYASRGLQKLTCLQTLPDCLGLRDGIGCTIDELGPLDQVKGNLCISGLEFVKNKEEAIGASLWRKDKILKLELYWGRSSEGHNAEVVLDGLEPHPNIQSLEIDGFCGVKFPTWIMTMNVGQSGHQTQLRHLKEVKLTNCRRCKQLPSLGQLSKLRILRLKGFDEVERIGEEFYENETNIGEIKVLFPELRELYFKNFKSLTTWMPPSPTPPTPRSCFPKLETLEIKSCPELERLPSLPLKSLKHVKLRDVGVNSLEVTGMNEIVSQREELSNCINLQTLKMINCEKVKWIHIEDATQLSHLTEVRLTNKVCKKLPSLGQLPKLAILRLEGFDEVEMIGEEFYESNSYIGEIKVLFPELRELYFENFKRLTTWMPPSPTPTTLSCFPTLETLEIKSCPELERLPSLPLKSLKHVKLWDVGVNSLEVTGMNEIGSQREELSNCINLQTLKMFNCEKVKWIHVEDATQLSNLTEVRLTNCKVCKKLPFLGQLPKLTILTLEGFDEVECIGKEFYENSNDINCDMKELFPTLRELFIREFKSLSSWVPPNLGLATTSAFPKLETLEIEGCRLLEAVPTLLFESLKNLKLSNIGGNEALDMIKGNPGLNSLTVRGMKEVERLPKELSNCIKLQKLEIEDCEKMKWIPSGIISLEQLTVQKCPSVRSIEEGVLQGLSSLRELYIEECSGLSRLPENLIDCTCLEVLSIEDCPLRIEEEDAIPDIGKLQGLKRLALTNVGGLIAYSMQWIPHLHGLKELYITGWGEVEWDMSLTSSLPSLKYMNLRNFPNLKPLVPQHLLPPSLERLTINGFEEMEALPNWIGDLSSLRYLQLEECKKLKYLPSKQAMLRLSQLSCLDIRGCPLLEKRCDKRNGPEWPKISHLPTIVINRHSPIEEGQKNRCWVI